MVAVQLEPGALRILRGQLVGHVHTCGPLRAVCSPLIHARRGPTMSSVQGHPRSLIPAFRLPWKTSKDLDPSYTPPPGCAFSPDSRALHGRLAPFHVKCAEHSLSGPRALIRSVCLCRASPEPVPGGRISWMGGWSARVGVPECAFWPESRLRLGRPPCSPRATARCTV